MTRIMGVDLGIHKVAWSMWQDGELDHTGAFESSAITRHDTLKELGLATGSIVGLYQPNHVFIEDTLIGNNRKYSMQLSETKGAVLSALAMTLTQDPREIGMGIYMANVQTWKKETVGSGNASKLMVKKYITELDSAYAELCEDDQDRFDAACIGYYGCLIEQRARGLSHTDAG